MDVLLGKTFSTLISVNDAPRLSSSFCDVENG